MKLQITFTDEAWSILESLKKEANSNYDYGSVSLSDVVNEALTTAKIDIKLLQAKHADIRKSLRLLLSKDDLDLEVAIQHLTEIKGRASKKGARGNQSGEGGS